MSVLPHLYPENQAWHVFRDLGTRAQTHGDDALAPWWEER